MIFSLFSIGLISILGQVVLLRELNVAFYGVELIYLLALGIWLFWTATGALIGRKSYIPTSTQIAVLFLLFGIALPLDVVFIRASRLLVSGVPGAYLSFLQQLVITVISLLPVGIVSGLLFQWAARSYVAGDRTLASAYAIESAGGLAGGLSATLFLTWGSQNCALAFICGLVSIITPLISLREGKISSLRITLTAFTGLFIILLFNNSPIDRIMTGWNHPNLLSSKDSPYGRITVTKLFDQISVFENDALAFETEGIEAEYFCHLTALQHPNPRTVLLLGGGIEGLVREMVQHVPERIDYVELNPMMLEMVTPHLPGDIQESLKHRNLRITLADPRRFIMESSLYDLILVGMPEPTSGQANRFYTQEFFRQCAAKLNPGGILGLRLRSAENIWTPPLTKRTVSIYRALSAVFSEVLFFPGTTNIVTASRTPLPGTSEIMARRLQERDIKTRLISPQYLRYLYTNDRFFEIRDLLQREKALPNTDIRPVCYQYAFMIWLSKFFPRITTIDFSSLTDGGNGNPLSPLLWISLPAVFLVSRFIPSFRRILLVFAAGFLGMVLETILILYYQVKHGVLYQDIGMLLMSFMAGLALGSMTINRMTHRYSGKPGLVRWWGVGLIIGCCLLCVIIATKVTMSTVTGLSQTAGFLAIAGFLVAGIFAYASLHQIKDQQSVISPLYSADLFGGCLGSLSSSMILIPMAGMDVTIRWMLIFSVFSLLLV